MQEVKNDVSKTASDLKIMNSVDAMYDVTLVPLKNGINLCPVCGKTFAKFWALERHFAQKNCHTLRDVAKGTLTELRAYQLYKDVISEVNPKARISLKTFIKSKFYNQFVRLSMFCTLHEITDVLAYLDWLNQIKNLTNLPTLLKVGIEEQSMREFRLFSHSCDLMGSAKFFERFKDELESDDLFFIRSIEKAKISIYWLAMNHPDFDGRMNRLPVDYQNRIMELVNTLEEKGLGIKG